jgi:RNA polymerase sigma-70 factor (ECF subfamily)
MMDIEDAVRKARGGDLAAYERVVRAAQEPLRAYIAFHCPVRQRVDETAQEAFIWAFEHLERYTPGTAFMAWLKQIARIKLMQALEAEQREAHNRRRYLEVLHLRRCHEELEAEGQEEAADRSAALRECLQKLPEPMRRLVSERFGERRPIEALAAARNRSPGAIKMALLRIRQALRKCIEARPGRPDTAAADA